MPLVASARRLILSLIMRITGAARMKPRRTMLTSTFPPGNPDPKFHNIRWQVFCAAWQAFHVLDLELAHGLGSGIAQRHFLINHPRKRLCGHSGASFFHQAVFAEFLIFVWRNNRLGINLDVPALVYSEILGKFNHLVFAVRQRRTARLRLVAL